MRIISLVPSLTELLFELGLENEIVGVTRFCIHPKNQTKLVTKIGGTKTVKIDRVREIQPDLIIANKEENSQSDILELQKQFDVLLTDIYSLDDALEAINQIGVKTNTVKKALQLVNAIKSNFKNFKTYPNKKVAYIIWEKPTMLAGKQTFINDMLQRLNLDNISTDINSRYPEFNRQEIINAKPDFIFLSSEPFPFSEKHREIWSKNHPNSRIVLVDGEMFSWYGSRLKYAPEYFENLISNLHLN